MLKTNKYKEIYKKIKKYDVIVLARHIGADPDALGSTMGLRDVIMNTFPNKKVYAVGTPANKFKYLGILDKFDEEMYKNSLLIVCDTPDKKRVDGVDASKFSDSIKIDHHPFTDNFCKTEWIDEKASSASQMVIELIFNTKLKLTKEAAKKLYIGLVADTNRFLFYYTTSKTFDLVSKLIKETDLDFTLLYDSLYMRSLREIKFQGYIQMNMTVTDNGLAYIKLDDEILKEYEVDSATAGNMVNNFNYIDEVYAWAVFSYDRNTDLIRGSIRSRGPIINSIAALFNGGGHIYASGVRLNDFDEAELLAEKLDEACGEYKKMQN